MAGSLDGAGFMDVDVSGGGGDGGLEGAKERSDRHQVGLGAAHQEVDIRVFAADLFFYGSGGGLRMDVQPVSVILLQIGVDQGL